MHGRQFCLMPTILVVDYNQAVFAYSTTMTKPSNNHLLHKLPQNNNLIIIKHMSSDRIPKISVTLATVLTSPTSISKIRTPSPHQSTARVYEDSVNTSGARNSGVPQNVDVRSPKPIPSLHRPKSAIFTKPSASSSRLSSFRSLKQQTDAINLYTTFHKWELQSWRITAASTNGKL